jgi:flavin reductase (DIM6/NTAB) family NADH-FMN oxidoreductase RutF
LRKSVSDLTSFDAMISYAASKGWVDEEASHVRAHIEWANPSTDAAHTNGARPSAISPDSFRHTLGHFIPGVTIVTSITDTGPVGFTCQSFSALSLDPPLILICPAKTSTTWPLNSAQGHLAVNVLSASQEQLCRSFSRSGSDKFAGVGWRSGLQCGAPILDDVLGHLECRIEEVHEGGDHWIVTARVEACEVNDEKPLTFFQGRLGSIARPMTSGSVTS